MSSYISQDGTIRLEKLYSFLDKEGLIRETNLRTIQNEDFATFFGISDEVDLPAWGMCLYKRNKMAGDNQILRKKETLIQSVIEKSQLESSSGDFNVIFKDCAREIELYINERNHWYSKISKDRLLFLEKLFWMIKVLSENNNEEEKIIHFSKLVKALSDIIINRVWIGSDWGNTSINHVLQRVCDELAVATVTYVVKVKTTMSSVALEKLNTKLVNLIDVFKSALVNTIVSEHYNGKYLFKKIEDLKKSTSAQKSFTTIQLYKISAHEFKIQDKEKKYKKSNHSVYFRIELKNHYNEDKETIFIECRIENFPVDKSIHDLTEEEKIRLDYLSHMIVNYIRSLLWLLRHAQYLTSISDYAFVQSIKGKDRKNNVVETFVRQDSINFRQKNEPKKSLNPFGSCESLVNKTEGTKNLYPTLSSSNSSLNLVATQNTSLISNKNSNSNLSRISETTTACSVTPVKTKGTKHSHHFLNNFKKLRNTFPLFGKSKKKVESSSMKSSELTKTQSSLDLKKGESSLSLKDVIKEELYI